MVSSIYEYLRIDGCIYKYLKSEGYGINEYLGSYGDCIKYIWIFEKWGISYKVYMKIWEVRDMV